MHITYLSCVYPQPVIDISSTEDLEGLEDSKLRVLSLKGNPLMDKMAEKEIIESIQKYCPTLIEFNDKQL